jgi:hypothetical protein
VSRGITVRISSGNLVARRHATRSDTKITVHINRHMFSKFLSYVFPQLWRKNVRFFYLQYCRLATKRYPSRFFFVKIAKFTKLYFEGMLEAFLCRYNFLNESVPKALFIWNYQQAFKSTTIAACFEINYICTYLHRYVDRYSSIFLYAQYYKTNGKLANPDIQHDGIVRTIFLCSCTATYIRYSCK